jgi:Na+/H+ antiporter NhaD/arsenite permease-like protein
MELEDSDLTWKSYVSLAVFLVTLIFVIQPLEFPLPVRLRGSRWALLATLDCATAPLLATLFLLAAHCTDGRDIRLGIVGTPDGLQPYTIIILFFALAYLCISLDVTGILHHIAYKAVRATSTMLGMFRIAYGLAACLTVVTSNDIVVLTLTPLITYMAAACRVDPIPHLMAQFQAANSWSTLLYIGNPTNIILCQAFGITFMQYSAWMSLPSVFSNVVAFAVISLIFHPSNSWGPGGFCDPDSHLPPDTENPKAAESPPAHSPSHTDSPTTADNGRQIRMPDASHAPGVENTSVDLSAIDVQPSPVHSMRGDSCTSVASNRDRDHNEAYHTYDKCAAIFTGVVLVACIVTLLLTSVTPIPVWAATLPFAAVVCARDARHDLHEFRLTRRDWRAPRLSKKDSSIKLVPDSPQEDVPHQAHPPEAKYIIPGVCARLPWKVVPFVLCTFILVETLQSTGWVAIAGNFVFRIGRLSLLPALMATGFLAIITIAACNNQPMTILIAKILLHAVGKAGRGPKNLASSDLAVVFTCVVASNLGALLTLNGALAGLMWMKILKDRNILLSIGRFMGIGSIVVVPAFVTAMIVLWIEVQVVS